MRKMEQKKKAIGTTTYLVTQLDAISALKIQTKLVKILGAGIFSMVGANGINKDKIVKMIPALLNDFDDKEVNELVLSLFERNVFTEVDGTPMKVEFATHFSGKPFEMWKVVGFILEANFSMGEFMPSSLPTTDQEEKKKDN